MRQNTGGFIGTVAGMGCFLQAILLGLYLWIGAWAVDTISNYFGIEFPWFIDVMIGLFTGWLAFWIAVGLAIIS